jgi:septal ring factor EnvC (AmiA/AmiB activator)
MVHPKLLKWKNVDLTKIQNLAAVDQDIADAERDLEILKQGLLPKLRQQFDNISVDKKELDSLKQRVQAEKQRRAQPQQPQSQQR